MFKNLNLEPINRIRCQIVLLYINIILLIEFLVRNTDLVDNSLNINILGTHLYITLYINRFLIFCLIIDYLPELIRTTTPSRASFETLPSLLAEDARRRSTLWHPTSPHPIRCSIDHPQTMKCFSMKMAQ